MTNYELNSLLKAKRAGGLLEDWFVIEREGVQVVIGTTVDDAKWGTGNIIHTSPVKSLTADHVVTQNSVYVLGNGLGNKESAEEVKATFWRFNSSDWEIMEGFLV